MNADPKRGSLRVEKKLDQRQVHFANGIKRNSEPVHFANSIDVLDEESKYGNSKLLDLFSNLFLWSEKYDTQLKKILGKFPPAYGSVLASIAMFIVGLCIRGDWLLFILYFAKYLQTWGSPTYQEESEELINSISDWFNIRLKSYWTIWFFSATVSYIIYFGLGGFLHWYYYVRQKDKPEQWKCQPRKWLSLAQERHAILFGSLGLLFTSFPSAVITTYVSNGGTAIWIYLNLCDYGYIWLVLQIPVVFIYQDYLTYWQHRIYHTPWLYKNFHKLHHMYKQPTAFSTTVVHPVELLNMQCVLFSAIFIIPVYWVNFAVIMIYIYYHAIIDHSGINFKRYWWQPWQPDCIFHDNHHQYFHVNFGFNIEFWDHLHGTYRRKDRIYRENIFYGKGKSIDEASANEIQEEIEERESENPLAFSDNKHEFDLDKDQINKKFKNC